MVSLLSEETSSPATENTPLTIRHVYKTFTKLAGRNPSSYLTDPETPRPTETQLTPLWRGLASRGSSCQATRYQTSHTSCCQTSFLHPSFFLLPARLQGSNYHTLTDFLLTAHIIPSCFSLQFPAYFPNSPFRFPALSLFP